MERRESYTKALVAGQAGIVSIEQPLQATKKVERVKEIDGLRGVAILGVVAVHAAIGMPELIQFAGIDITKLFIWSGRYGVQLFFVLSGLTLALSFQSRFRNRSNRSGAIFRDYFIRRFFRLTPLYYLILAFTAVVGYNNVIEAGTENPPGDALNYLVHILYIHGLFPQYVRSILGVTWSLTPEVIFYIILPVIVLFCRTFSQRVTFFVISFFVGDFFRRNWTLFMEASQTNAIWVELSPITLFFLFAAGVVLADVYEWAHRDDVRTSREWQIIANVLFLGSTYGFYWLYYNNSDAIWPWAMIIGFVAAFCLRSTWQEKILQFPPLQNLGMVSYSVFLVHFLLIDFLRPTVVQYTSGWPNSLYYIFFLTLIMMSSWAISLVTYRFIEVPGIALGSWLIRQLNSKKS